jgi:putative transposase
MAAMSRTLPRVRWILVRGQPTDAPSLAPGVGEGERFGSLRFLIRDRDSKFTGPFDEVFRSEGVKLIETPVRAPRANAFAERWVRMVRTECLDWMPIFGRRHLERIFRTYSSHYNAQRPHRGLDLETPEPRLDPASCLAGEARVRRRDVLRGLVHAYELAG